MRLREPYFIHLANPGPASWRGIIALLDDPSVTSDQHAAEVKILSSELAAWPPEIERAPPSHWLRLPETFAAEIALCHRVREVDLYRHYIDAAARAPALQLSIGGPAVRLERAFTGALQGAAGVAHRVGVKGQGDLSGSLCVEWTTTKVVASVTVSGSERVHALTESATRHASIHLEVEVKTDGGKVRPDQEIRAKAFERRGELYLIVRRTAEMVRLLVEARDRFRSMFCQQV